MNELGSKIDSAVASGKLSELFNDAMIKTACPGWAERTYNNLPVNMRLVMAKRQSYSCVFAGDGIA
jgi:hypothetical protein